MNKVWAQGYLAGYRNDDNNPYRGCDDHYVWLRGHYCGARSRYLGCKNRVAGKAYKDGKKGLPLPCDAVLKSWRAGRFDGGHI